MGKQKDSILTPATLVTNREGFIIVMEVEGAGQKYYAASGEKKQKGKVRPVKTEDYRNLFAALGIDYDKAHVKVKDFIEDSISKFPIEVLNNKVWGIAGGSGIIDGEYYYTFYYEYYKEDGK